MQTPERFRKYADECRHLAKLLSGEQKNALLEIATAWDECAANAEQNGNGDGKAALDGDGHGKAAFNAPPGRPKSR
jgi:hypothetical protein